MGKISEYCRLKNKELEKRDQERERAFNEKVQMMKQLDQFVQASNLKEQMIVEKFCLVLNEKKKKIAELERIIIQMQGSDD